jgi:Putative DNA-binding domain
MPNLTDKALEARRESKFIEFKQGFDCDSKGEWCEVIKDLVAVANSGGGIVVFGLGNTGEPVDTDLTKIAALDPADVSNKVGAYIGSNDFDFSIIDLEKGGKKLVAFLIEPATSPYVFERQGAYTDALGKQKSAFAIGTCYFRHGAKSEPATNDDLRKSVERQIDSFRKEWIDGVRKVVQAPAGSQVIIANPGAADNKVIGSVKLGSKPDATLVRLTRNTEGVAGTLMHEEISDELFTEINNVIGTNRVLFPGRNRFLLGSQAYYKIYAERHHVSQPSNEIVQLMCMGITEYCPFLFWCSLLSNKEIADHLADIILWPKGNEIQTLLRMTPLIGKDFYDWLGTKFSKKWGKYSQPPAFYWRFKDLLPKIGTANPQLISSRQSLQSQFDWDDGSPAKTVSELIANQSICNAFISKACLEVFKGNKEYRSTARDLDYLAYGQLIVARSEDISALVKGLVGDRLPNDEEATHEAEE